MALTDLLKEAGRVVQAAALGLAVYGCGGSDKPKVPYYEGMCDDYANFCRMDNVCGGASPEEVNDCSHDRVNNCKEYCNFTIEPSDGAIYDVCVSLFCDLKSNPTCPPGGGFLEFDLEQHRECIFETFNAEYYRHDPFGEG